MGIAENVSIDAENVSIVFLDVNAVKIEHFGSKKTDGDIDVVPVRSLGQQMNHPGGLAGHMEQHMPVFGIGMGILF